jgi:hypothetical protein
MLVKVGLIRGTGTMGATSQLLAQGIIIVEDITGATPAVGIMEGIPEAGTMEIVVEAILAEVTPEEGITKGSPHYPGRNIR